MAESWRPVVGYEAKYEVSDMGRVRRHKDGTPVGQWLGSRRYMQVRLSGPRSVKNVHRLVALAFIPSVDGKTAVNHIDFNKSNNAASNLEWCSQRENVQHSHRAGRMQQPARRGKRSPAAVLSDEEVRSARMQYASGRASWSLLANQFGVSKRCIGRAIRRETYGYVR